MNLRLSTLSPYSHFPNPLTKYGNRGDSRGLIRASVVPIQTLDIEDVKLLHFASFRLTRVSARDRGRQSKSFNCICPHQPLLYAFPRGEPWDSRAKDSNRHLPTDFNGWGHIEAYKLELTLDLGRVSHLFSLAITVCTLLHHQEGNGPKNPPSIEHHLHTTSPHPHWFLPDPYCYMWLLRCPSHLPATLRRPCHLSSAAAQLAPPVCIRWLVKSRLSNRL